MRYEGCLLVVKDAQTSKRFYQEVLQATPVHDLGVYVAFQEGFCLQQEETWLSFLDKGAEALTYGHHTGGLYFEDDALDAFQVRLAALPGIRLVHPVRQLPWGQRAIRFYDPDDHVLEVAESMNLVVKRFLREGLSVAEAAERSLFPVPFVEACAAELLLEQGPR